MRARHRVDTNTGNHKSFEWIMLCITNGKYSPQAQVQIIKEPEQFSHCETLTREEKLTEHPRSMTLHLGNYICLFSTHSSVTLASVDQSQHTFL